MPIKYGQYSIPPADVEVDFKVGQPAPSLLPLNSIRIATQYKLEETDPLYLQYGDIQGYKEFRSDLSQFLEQQYNQLVNPDNIFITNGVTGALQLICTFFTTPGDVVFAEDPTYFIALEIFRDFKLKVIQIPMDSDGVILNDLEKLLDEYKPKLFYTIPTAQNPTGRTLSQERRKKLVELAKKKNFYIISDEVYQLLTFSKKNQPPLPMFYYDENITNTFSINSFSKILAPALRLGWIYSSNDLLMPLVKSGIFNSSGGTSPFVSGIVHKCITMGLLNEHLNFVRNELSSRCDQLINMVKEHLVPLGVTYEVPLGGYFVLIKLPNGIKSKELLEYSTKNHKVRFLPGGAFGKKFDDHLRLSFSYYNSTDITTGIKRLKVAINELMQQPQIKDIDV